MAPDKAQAPQAIRRMVDVQVEGLRFQEHRESGFPIKGLSPTSTESNALPWRLSVMPAELERSHE
jgi:hypothetical protein